MQLVVHKGERFYKSFKPVAVLKRMLGVLFELVSKENIDRLTEQWAAESRNIVLLSGSSFSLETAIAFTYKVSKYFIGADAKLIRSKDNNDSSISFIIGMIGAQAFPISARGAFTICITFSLQNTSLSVMTPLTYTLR